MRRLLITGTTATTLLVAVGLVTGAVGSAGADGRQVDWPQLHQSAARAGFNAQEHRISRSNVTSLDQRWRTSVGGIQSRGPVVADGLVIDVADDHLVAVRARDGAHAWTTKLDTGAGFPPAIAGRTVYLAAGSSVQAFSLSSGHRRWRTTLGGSAGLGSPAVVGQTLYVGADGSRVYALDTRTGRKRWSVDAGAVIQSSVAVADGRVLVSTMDGALSAFRATNGKRIWRVNADAFSFGGGPAISDGVVYIAGGSGGGESITARLSAFRARDGRLRWTTTFRNDVHSIAAVAYGMVFVGGADARVQGFRASTGKMLWETMTSGSEVWGSVAVANHLVFLTTELSHLLALDAANGTVRLDRDMVDEGPSGATFSSPAVVNGTVFVNAGGGTLRAFTPRKHR